MPSPSRCISLPDNDPMDDDGPDDDMRAALQSLQQDFQRHVVSANQQNEKLLEAVQKCSSDILQHTG
eukprot:2882771-Karenia_brevis.AAC.1